MIDFDATVNRTALQTFGETVVYTQNGLSFALPCVFDEAWQTVEGVGRHPVPVSTTKPCIGCRLSDFPVGVTPRQGDTVTRNGKVRTVSHVQPDGLSGWQLIHLK